METQAAYKTDNYIHERISDAERALFSADREMWTVCEIAADIVGNYSNQTRTLADRLGKSVATIEFYAKAWRVHDYVKNEVVYCSISGRADAELICANITFSHYGKIHSKVFQSERTDSGMRYIPIMSAQEALSWLAECVEPLAEEGRRLSPEMLLSMMEGTQTFTQWHDVWPKLKNKLLNFFAEYGEKIDPEMRKLLSELIQKDW